MLQISRRWSSTPTLSGKRSSESSRSLTFARADGPTESARRWKSAGLKTTIALLEARLQESHRQAEERLQEVEARAQVSQRDTVRAVSSFPKGAPLSARSWSWTWTNIDDASGYYLAFVMDKYNAGSVNVLQRTNTLPHWGYFWSQQRACPEHELHLDLIDDRMDIDSDWDE